MLGVFLFFFFWWGMRGRGEMGLERIERLGLINGMNDESRK